MKHTYFVAYAAIICLLGACHSDSTISSTVTTSVSPPATGGLQRLKGTWAGYDKGGFTLVKIKADSTGAYTTFTDRERETGQPSPDDRYFLYESAIKVRYKPGNQYQPGVAIYTDNFRFDYYLSGDTLIEYDKMGEQGRLVRVQPDPH
ncbi:hypothetical protein KLP40_10950 [Hymenobacter sp. NST-14]|uniref:hypothetical protein n=1 Tax=Hymenobacter piscis TaxID=2839984 RepID=UPI001C031B57|nr:hypothetical protein [Hymenobacter piscis]MBT9393681.1 hypothetical protein [Hymenobacter piscis]